MQRKQLRSVKKNIIFKRIDLCEENKFLNLVYVFELRDYSFE